MSHTPTNVNKVAPENTGTFVHRHIYSSLYIFMLLKTEKVKVNKCSIHLDE